MPNCALRLTLRGHSCNVGAVVFHPCAVKEEESPVCALASCAADGSVKLWTMKRYADFMNGYGINAYVSGITNSQMVMFVMEWVAVCVLYKAAYCQTLIQFKSTRAFPFH